MANELPFEVTVYFVAKLFLFWLASDSRFMTDN